MSIPRTIALFSSSRRHGNTGALLDCVAGQLGIEVVDLGAARMSVYDYEHRNRDDDFEPLMRRALACDQLIFATPVYWYAPSPAMKIFLDRISDFLDLPDLLAEGRRLRGKQAYVVCTSIETEPSAHFIGRVRRYLQLLGYALRRGLARRLPRWLRGSQARGRCRGFCTALAGRRPCASQRLG